MRSDVASSEPDSSAGPVSPGDLLRGAREAQDISKREMADRLNWRHDFVDAVEENRFEVLRGETFVSGYLRTYARLLGLPEEQVLESLRQYTGQEPKQTRPVETRLPQVQKQGFAVPVGVAAALVVLLAMWWMGSSTEDEADTVAENAQPSEEVEAPGVASLPTPAEDPQSAQEELQTREPAQSIAAPADVVESPADVASVPAPAAAPEPAPRLVTPREQPQAVPQPEPAAEPLPVAGEETLAFRFSKDCWLEVRDGNSELIYADLRRAGDVLNVSGAVPFKVLVGDASAVQLRFRDEAVDIPVRPGRTTSRFTVGE